MSDGITVIGIDVAAARPSIAVAMLGRAAAVRGGRGGARQASSATAPADHATVLEWMETDPRQPDQVAAMMAWIARHEPAVVAVDAPQGYRRERRGSPAAARALPAGAARIASRVCDSELLARRISVYPVPSRRDVDDGAARLAEWMNVGFDYFRRLRRLGFELPDDVVMPGALGGPPAVLEVYPYGAFATLLGYLPAKKSTRAGLHQRVVMLRRAGLEWDEYFDHDSLDALAAALTAWRFAQGRATPLGDPREGLVWLPVQVSDLKDSYRPV